MTTLAPKAETLSCGSNTTMLVHEYSIVNLNNCALSCFLQRDFDQAKEHILRAYDICLRKLKVYPLSSESFPVTLIEPVEDINEYAARINQDPSIIDEDGEHETAHATTSESKSCYEQPAHAISSSDFERSHLFDQNDGDRRDEDAASVLMGHPGQTSSIPPRLASHPAVHTMYNRALVLSSPQDEDINMLVRTRAVLLYNLALVHHNIGIHRGVSWALWEALKYYELAMDTLDSQIPRTCGPGGSISTAALSFMWRTLNVEKLLMAILNNMGNIHAHLFHLENTRACMVSLRMVLEASVAVSRIIEHSGNYGEDSPIPIGRNETTSNVLAMSEDYIFFLLNSIFQANALLLAAAA